jgi:glucose-6-phosphate dehydrogenase assembly protein OpcA
VTIAAAPAGWTHLPGLIVPLLIPDLPVFLYWPDMELDGRPEGKELRVELLDHSDYLILDSARCVDPEGALIFMSDLAATGRQRQEPRDLNWSRLLPWREALADLFEPAEHRSWLGEIQDIEIEALRGDAAPDAGFPARPLLALSWLSERLGWVPRQARRDGDRVEVLFHDDRQARLVLGQGDGTRGALRAVRLALSKRRTIEVSRPAETTFEALITGEGRDALRKSLPRRVESEESILCGELDRRGTDRIFTAALLRAASLVRSMETLPGSHR